MVSEQIDKLLTRAARSDQVGEFCYWQSRELTVIGFFKEQCQSGRLRQS